MRSSCLLLALVLLAPLALSAQEAEVQPVETADEISACALRNVPSPDQVRAIRITTRDRMGSQNVTVARVFTHRGSNGLGQVLVRLVEPEEVRDSSLLILEQRDGENQMYFKASEQERPKRVTGAGKASRLFGTDFTYEDFERLEGVEREADATRLPDSSLSGRSVFVIEARPTADAKSAYERVLTFVDQETCVALRTEMYEPGRGLRKELVINADSVRKHGDVWVPHMALLRDLRDSTTTQILVDSSEQEQLPPEMFTLQALYRTTGP